METLTWATQQEDEMTAEEDTPRVFSPGHFLPARHPRLSWCLLCVSAVRIVNSTYVRATPSQLTPLCWWKLPLPDRQRSRAAEKSLVAAVLTWATAKVLMDGSTITEERARDCHESRVTRRESGGQSGTRSFHLGHKARGVPPDAPKRQPQGTLLSVPIPLSILPFYKLLRVFF